MTPTASTASSTIKASIFDIHWPQYRAIGLYTVPIGPGSKAPHVFTGMVNDEPTYVLMAHWTQRSQTTSPQPGAGSGLLCGKSDDPDWVIIALDFDNEEIALKLYDRLPDSQIGKIGQRGDTRFYKARKGAVASRKFRINKRTVFEILAAGCQTVLPPTIHPDINSPYRWSSDNTLLNRDWRDLPELPDNVVEIVEEVLRPFGYEQDLEKTAAEDGSPYKDFNQFCQQRIDMWVPDLKLPKLSRSGRRIIVYKAVAFWRESTEGRKLTDRDPNLKISRSVIFDHGNDQAYSPLDLVMAAKNLTLPEAWAWLDEKTGWSKRGPDIDWKGLGVEEEDEPEAETESRPKEEAKDGATKRKYRFKLVAFKDMRPPSSSISSTSSCRSRAW
jgi:Bifunctional DNA primase/polymerase, N-terminal